MNPELQKAFDQLEELRQELFRQLAGLNERQLNFKAAVDKWSVVQVLQHLLQSEQGTYLYMTKKSQAESLPQLGLAAALRCLILNAALRSPLKFKKSKRLQEPSPAMPLAEVQQQWQVVRGKLKDFLARLPADRTKVFIFRHPFAGPFNISQTLSFIGEHIKHHMRQVERIKNSDDFPNS